MKTSWDVLSVDVVYHGSVVLGRRRSSSTGECLVLLLFFFFFRFSACLPFLVVSPAIARREGRLAQVYDERRGEAVDRGTSEESRKEGEEQR